MDKSLIFFAAMQDCYKFSDGKAIFGSGTRFPPVDVKGRTRVPGQVRTPDRPFDARSLEVT